MKNLFVTFALLLGCVFHCFSQNLVDQIQKINISTNQPLAYNTYDLFYGDLIPSVQISRWKQGYIIAYTTFDRHSRFFFTDQNFKKISSEKELTNRIIFQIVTDNNEIAFLTGSRDVDDSEEELEIAFDFIYFTKVSEQGNIILDQEIIGTNDLLKAGAVVLDNLGNFNMKWTGKVYMLFFPIRHNFAEQGEDYDIHQGACAYMIKSDGTLYSFFDWNNSHSFEHRILMTQTHAILLAKGDAPRGLSVEWYPIDKYHLEEIGDEPEDQDLGHPSLQYYYMYDDTQEHSCDAFSVSGQNGDNYVPFSIGSAVELPNKSILISCSFAEQKPTHDISLLKVKPTKENCTSGHKFITNTPSVCEHSVQMNRIGENRMLIRWKEFPTKSDATLKKLYKQYDDEKEDELILTRHNPDQNKLAIIDNNGNFIVKPQVVATKQADWYYTSPYLEKGTQWHLIMGALANHTLSESIYTSEGKLVWGNHLHKSKTISIYIFTP